VVNRSGRAVGPVQISASLISSDGLVRYVGLGFAEKDGLTDGESSPFKIDLLGLDDAGQIERFELFIEGVAT
jgi:hypothetical protein